MTRPTSISDQARRLIWRSLRSDERASHRRERRAQRRAVRVAVQRMHFEALESRLLLSADVLPVPVALLPMGREQETQVLTSALSVGSLASIQSAWVPDFDAGAFTSELTPLPPNGSFVHAGGVSGSIDTDLGDSSVSLAVQGGQAVALRFTSADSELQARMEAWQDGPGGSALLGFVEAGQAGGQLTLQVTMPVDGGDLRIELISLAGTGAWDLELFLGAALETGDSSNSADAVALDGLLSPLPGGIGERASVIGTLSRGIGPSVVDREDFESGALDDRWTVSTTGNQEYYVDYWGGENRYTLYSYGEDTGEYSDNFSEFVLSFELASADADGLMLQFDQWGRDPQDDPFSGGLFSGSQYADGVAVSVDGTTWVPVAGGPRMDGYDPERHRIDLGAELAAYGLIPSGELFIKFQHANSTVQTGSDGEGNPYYDVGYRYWDNIVVEQQGSRRWALPASVANQGSGQVYGDLSILVDGVTPADWTWPYDDGASVYWYGDTSGAPDVQLVFDLGSEMLVADLAMSLLAGSDYLVESSTDGASWSELVLVDRLATGDRDTNLQRFSTVQGEPGYAPAYGFDPTSARYLRVSAVGGNGEGEFALAELQVLAADPQQVEDTEDWFSLSLGEGQFASVALAAPRESLSPGGDLRLEFLDSAGQMLSFADAGAGGVTGFARFQAPADDVYLVRVSGIDIGDYHLAVTRDAQLSVLSALSADITALPVVATRIDEASGGGGIIRVAVHRDAGFLVNSLNDATGFAIAAQSVTGAEIDTLAELSNFDVVIIGNHNYQQELDGMASALHDWVQAGGGLVATGWTVYSAGAATSAPLPALDAVIPVDTAGNYSNTYNQALIYNGVAHPLTQGLADFTLAGRYSEYATGGVDDGGLILATAGGQHAVVVGQYDNGRSAYLGPTYFYDGAFGAGSGLDQLLERAVIWTSGSGDAAFLVSAEAGDELVLDVFRAGNASAAPINDLQVRITVFDADGNVVASELGEQLTLQVAASGAYTAVLSSAAGAGDLVLQVSGSTANLELALGVVATSLDGFTRGTEFPTYVDVVLDAPLLLSSVDASDMTINGEAVERVDVLDAHSLRFWLQAPGGDGSHELDIAPGSLRSLDGREFGGWSTSFEIDTTLPVVTASGLTPEVVLDGNPLVVAFDFSEALLASGLNASDVRLQSLTTGTTYSLASFSVDADALGVQVGLPTLPEGRYRLTLFAYGFYDLLGWPLNGAPSFPLPSGAGDNSADNFVVEFVVDRAPQALGELPALAPAGGLVHGKTVAGALHDSSDVDDYTLRIDAGQLLTVALDPVTAGSALAMRIELFDAGSVLVASAESMAGSGVLLQTLGQGTPLVGGAYTLRITGQAGNGAYRLTTALGARAEAEHVAGGASNDALAAAEDLSSSLMPIGNGGSRVAVIGTRTTTAGAESGNDIYRISLGVGDFLSAALAWGSAGSTGTLVLDLLAPDGTLITSSESGLSAGGTQRIADFRAGDAGDYLLRVRGSGNGLYTLVATRQLSFDLALTLSETAQDISHTRQVLGSLGSGSVGGSGAVRVAVHGGTVQIVNALNDSTLANIVAVSVSGSQIDSLDELSAYDVVMFGGSSVQSQFELFDTPLRQWVEAGGGVVATGWTVYGAGTATGTALPDIDAIVPVITSGSYHYNYAGTMTIVDAAHPVTEGLTSFSMPGIYSEYPVSGVDPGAAVLATVNTRPAVVVGSAGLGRGVYLGPTVTEWGGTPAGNLDRLIEQAVLWAGGDRIDDFLISVNAGDSLNLLTRTPGDGPDQPVNLLDPLIELYGPGGSIVASAANGAADGRNARVDFVAADGGTYRVRVRSEGGSGAYVLEVTGATGVPLVTTPTVVSATPAEGAVISVAPSTLVFQLSEGVRADSLNLTDLVLDSGGTVTSVQLLSGNRVQFGISVTPAEGLFEYHLVDGAFNSLQGEASAAYEGDFIFDLGGPRVVSSTPAADAGAPLATWAFTFSEAIDPASVSSADVVTFTGPSGQNLRNSIGSVTVAGNVLTVSFSNQFETGNYTMVIGPDIRDLAGNPMDQDTDGSKGEAVEDRYSASVTLRSPDLQPQTISVPETGVFGQPISVTWTVSNVGDAPAQDSWWDRLVLSSDTTPGNDTYLGEFEVFPNPLGADASYTLTRQVTLPLDVGLAAGNYHVLVLSDYYNQQGEANNADNALASSALALTVPPFADLTVSGISAPALIEAGKPVTIEWTVNNEGNAATPNAWYDYVYLSNDANIGGDVEISWVYYNNSLAIAAGGSLARSAQITIPTSLVGSWRVVVHSDIYNNIYEHDQEDDNAAISAAQVQVIVPTEDLTVSNVGVTGNLVFGEPVTVAWTVNNQGTGPTLGNWTDRVWLSRDGTVGGDDIHLGDFVSTGNTPLGAGGSYERSRTITLPLNAGFSTGEYRVLVVTDGYGNEPESNENNNTGSTGALALTLPPLADLAISGVTVPAGLRSGDSADIVYTLTNNGTAPASDFRQRLVLNDTAGYADYEAFLGDLVFSDTLSPGESVQITQRVTFPLTQPGSWHVVAVTDIGGQIYEHNLENNNTASSALFNLPLPPLVDLRVTSIAAPLDGIAGQPVQISWTVVNEGDAPLSGTFNDAVYLRNGTGSLPGTHVGTFTFEGSLGAGASVMRTQTITLPANLAANYTVVIDTDSSNQYYEAGGELDNRTIDDTQIHTVLPPVPNLVIDSVTPPSEMFSSTQTEVSWVVRNLGNGSTSTPTWYDEVHLSLNNVFGDADDIYLGVATNPSYLAATDSYVNHLTFNVPRGLAGDFYLLVRTDIYNQVFEDTAEGDNTRASTLTRVNLTPPPDLQVQTVNAPSQAFSGQPMSISWTIVNEGNGRTLESGWYDRVFVSTDDVFDGSDLQLGQFFHSGALDPDETYSRNESVTLPIGQFGPRWFFVVTDALNHVYEHVREGNNSGFDATATQVLLTPPPDLEVESITVPETVRAGDTLNLSFTVTNFGATPTAESVWSDRVYLSTNDTLDAGDLLLATRTHYGALAVEGSYTVNVAVTAPNALAGPYHVIVKTDAQSQVFEGFAGGGFDPEGNNVTASDDPVLLELRPANLVIDSFSAPAAGEAGKPITVNWTLRNDGTGSVQANWTDRVMLSSDALIGDDDDIVLGSLNQDTRLAVGASVTQSLAVNLPFTLVGGDYIVYLRSDANNTVFEGAAGSPGEGDNVATSPIALTRLTPDLVASGLAITLPATAAGRLVVDWHVDNIGQNRTNSTYWYDEAYLSRDTTLGGGDLYVGSHYRSNPLDPGQSYDVSASFALPAGLGSGDYYLIVRTDARGYVIEGDAGEGNNVAVLIDTQTVPMPINIPPAIVPAPPATDLSVTLVDAPADAISGQAITVNWTVTNFGPEATGNRNWYDSVFLSRDGVFDRNTDLYLGFRNHTGGLGNGESYDASGSFTVPLGQSGPFYVFVVSDRGGQLPETNETNNAGFDGQFTQVTLAPPADLIVGTITIPDNAVPGSNATISYSVTNQGTNPALGSWRDTLYISTDGTWDIGDLPFGSVTVGGPLPGGSSYSRSVTAALPGVTPGTYQVIVRSDILNNVAESNDANNLLATLDGIEVDVLSLALGTPLSGTLGAGQSLFYKFTVGAGETVRVTLDGAGDSNGNELYLREGAMPTRGQFDEASKEPFNPDQVAVIPTTEAGTYYVMLFGANGAAQPFSLLAEIVPFSLASVEHDTIGDAGPATLLVEGARFNGATQFYLLNGDGERIDASPVFIESGSEAFVTFDARGATLGAYTLHALSGNVDVTLAGTPITVVQGGGAELTRRFDGPAQVRPGRLVLANVTYANDGDVDLMAPLIIVTSPTGTAFGSTAESLGLSSSVQYLAVGSSGDPNVLRPGDQNSLPLLFRTVNAPMRFTSRAYLATDTRAIDYDLVQRSLRPAGLTDSEWDARWFGALQPRIGVTWGDYVRLVNQLNERYSTPDRTITDVRELFALAFAEDPSFVASMNYIGQLFDAETGLPLVGAEVAAYLEGPTGAALMSRTTTGTDGRFLLPYLQPGTYSLALARTTTSEDGSPNNERDFAWDQNRNGISDAIAPSFTIQAGDLVGTALYARLIPEEPVPANNDAAPAMATDSVGRLHLVWNRDGEFWHAVDEGGGWQDAQPLPGHLDGSGLILVADPLLVNGTSEGLLAAWRQGEGNEAEVWYSIGARQTDGTYHWTAAAQLTDNSQFDGAFAVGIGSDGNPALIVQRKDAANANDDIDLYGTEIEVIDPVFLSALAADTEAFADWLAAQSDEQLEALGIHRVRFSKSIGNVNIPLIGSVKAEIRVDFQAQIDCTLVYRGNGAFKFDLNTRAGKVEIEGRAGGDVRFKVDKDACAYVFDSARINGQVAGAINFPLTWVPFIGPALTAIGVQGRFEVAAGGSLIWETGSSFPGWWSNAQGSFRGSLGFNWEGSIPWTGIEAVVRGLVNVNGKWDDDGLGLRDPPISGSILLRIKHGWFFGGTGWTEYTYSIPGSDLGSTGIDGELLTLDEESIFGGSAYDTAVVFGFDPPAPGTSNVYTGSGETIVTDNLVGESAPVIAESASGALWAAWSTDAGVSVTERVNGAWAAASLIPGSGGMSIRGLALAFDGQGRLVALWNRLDTSGLTATSSSEQIEAVMEDGGDLVCATLSGGSWSAVTAFGGIDGEEQAPVLHRLANGDVLAAWTLRTTELTEYRPQVLVQAALWSAASGTWGAVQDVAQGRLAGDLRLTISSSGARLLWAEAVNTTGSSVLRSSAFSGSGWAAAETLQIAVSTSLVDLSQAILAAGATPLETSSWYLPAVPEDCCDDDDDDDDDDDEPYDPEPVVPRDPNDILGPEGFGDERWIPATDTFAYKIRFENASDAAAPAQEVIVTQQLDADLDWRSFRVDDFGFGDQIVQLDGKSAFYSQRLDFTDTRGFLLDVSATVDLATGIVTWKLTTIDPETGEIPEDAQLGFLPPNIDEEGVKDGRGEGFLTYTVKAKRNTPTGTVIDAEARIVFDTEEPIDTPPIFNTLDSGKPASEVQPLPEFSDDTEFLVSWIGIDPEGGSAIASFTLYVSRDGGAFEAWLTDTTLTEAVYEGESGSRYAFYSVARDNAGNVEGAPAEADAEITVASGGGSIAGLVYDDSDGDGTRDGGEPGLAGWAVFIDADDDGLLDTDERTTLTDGNGGYRFDGVAPGTVVVGVIAEFGWLHVVPADGFQPVTAVADETATGVDFGHFLAGVLGGNAFDDLNANGVKDDGDASLSGLTVRLDRDSDGSIDDTTTTAGDGSYSFDGLMADSFTLSIILPDGRLLTAPSGGTHTASVVSGTDTDTLHFGSVEAASLAGTVYQDTDGDGTHDAGEPGLADRTVFLDTNGNATLDDGERSSESGGDGGYLFTGLLPGSYTVLQVVPTGWVQTAPGASGSAIGSTVLDGLVYTGSTQLLETPDTGPATSATATSNGSSNAAAWTLIGVDELRADSRFSGLDGSGVGVVVIDTGIDLNHPFFGVDANSNGVADRIVYQYDFANDDADASDRSGHGSHIASLIGSADGAYGGVAPGVDLIALKVFQDSGPGMFSYLENALRWVVAHADEYGIGVVNLSLGDGGNWTSEAGRFGLGDELAALAAKNIIVTAASGNHFARFGGAWGVAYPGADPSVLAVGASWAEDLGGPWVFSGGATDQTTGSDRIASFSQRDDSLLDVFAPGTRLVGADAHGGTRTMQGTSQASAVMAGVAALAQDLALQTLGRRLTLAEFDALLAQTSTVIVDGDDERDNVRNSGLNFARVDVMALAEAILAMPAGSGGGGSGGTGGGGGSGTPGVASASPGHSVTLATGGDATGLDFGNFELGRIEGIVWDDADNDGVRDAGEAGLGGFTVFLDADNDGALDGGEANTITAGDGSWAFADLGPGERHIALAPQAGYKPLPATATTTLASGQTAVLNLSVNALPTLDAVGDQVLAEGQTLTLGLSGHDSSGDTLHYSLLGETGGATLNQNTGELQWFAADGPANRLFTVRVTDSAGSTAERSFGVVVINVAPTLALTGATSAVPGASYELTLSASDPGTDTITEWVIHWGDGSSETMAGNPSLLSHVYAASGVYAISGSATDEDGSYPVTGPQVNVTSQPGRIEGTVYEDADADGQKDAGEGGLAGFTVYLDNNNNGQLDGGEASALSGAQGAYAFEGQAAGTRTVRLVTPDGYKGITTSVAVQVAAGATVVANLSANTKPTLDAVADQALNEGQTLTLSLGGHDTAADTLQYSLVGTAPAGATLNASTGALQWLAADGASQAQFTVRVTDSAGSAAERSFTANVANVAPTLSATGATSAVEGVDYVLALAASDPGTDTIAQWIIDWGDGIVQTLSGNPSQAVHRYAGVGSYAIGATATDEDGSFTVAGPTVNVALGALKVTSFSAGDSGFALRFNREINRGVLNLYTAADNPMGAADIVVTDAAGQAVAGSVVVDADGKGLSFIRTGGTLAAGTYGVRLASGAQAFVDTAGGALDGNADGTRGDAYERAFSVTGSGALLSIGDIARGPGQAVNVPATGAGLPITLSDAAGATTVSFELAYNAALLSVTGAANGAGLPSGSTLSVDLSTAGLVRVTVIAGSPLGAGAIELVRLQANVPAGATLGAAQVLDLRAVQINAGAIAARADDGVHVAAYLADVDASRSYTTQDVTRMQRVITRADTGFGPFLLIAPVVIGDVNGSGTLTSLDAARLLQQVTTGNRPEFPALPPQPLGISDEGGASRVLAARVDFGGSLGTTASALQPGNEASANAWVNDWLQPRPTVAHTGLSLRATVGSVQAL